MLGRKRGGFSALDDLMANTSMMKRAQTVNSHAFAKAKTEVAEGLRAPRESKPGLHGIRQKSIGGLKPLTYFCQVLESLELVPKRT